MIIIEQNNTTNFEDLYCETPSTWYNTIHDMIDEIDSLLKLYNLSSDTISYDQIKEKYSTLRTYWHLGVELEDDLTDEQQLFYRCLNGMICAIVEKYEKLIKLKIEKGIL